MAMIPALYEKAKRDHPDAKITVENGQGKSFVAESVNENGIMYKAGVKKYGKEGMTKIQSAAGKDLGHEEIGKIKDKYEKGKKGKNEAIDEDITESKVAEASIEAIEDYQANKNKPQNVKKIIGLLGGEIQDVIKILNKYKDPYDAMKHIMDLND
jgi:hypothetical protein